MVRDRAALREVSPRLGFVMVVGFAATLGLPGLVGFWGEFLAMFAAWSPAADRPLGLFRACTVLAVLGTGLAAAYSLRVLRTVWAGERPEPGLVDARGGELAVLAVLVVAVVALGVLPGPLLQTTIADVTAITTPGSVIR